MATTITYTRNGVTIVSIEWRDTTYHEKQEQGNSQKWHKLGQSEEKKIQRSGRDVDAVTFCIYLVFPSNYFVCRYKIYFYFV